VEQVELPPQLAPPPQLVLIHFQLAQLPLEGPLEVPVWQAAEVSHQPQLVVTVHPVQLVKAAHGSVEEPEHELEYQTQSLQEPVEGPAAAPVWHLFVPLHQPQSARPVQASQAVDEEQGSVVVVAQAPLSQVRPEQQSAVVLQLCEPVRHMHLPLSQSIHPQQS
jgi:hypothetical protein